MEPVRTGTDLLMTSPSPNGRTNAPRMIVRVAALFFSIKPFSSASLTAFCHSREPWLGHNSCLSPRRMLPSPPSTFKNNFAATTAINVSQDRAKSIEEYSGPGVEQEQQSYPVQVRHQGHIATISVRENEPILQALERQSTFSKGKGERNGTNWGKSSLALSNIPHECRRGNCLTCSSRIVNTSNTQNVLANVDHGLSPTVASELKRAGYLLTCCSFVTGPGVVLELDQNDSVWDLVYRQRICNPNSKQIATEAQARLLRRVDEENLGKWKRRMEENWERKDKEK